MRNRHMETIGSLIDRIAVVRYRVSNFQTVKKEIGEKRLKDFFTTLYPQFTTTEIETITGIPHKSLGYWFKRLGIPLIRHHNTTILVPGDTEGQAIVSKGQNTYRILTIKITPELAYTIGFALGDGAIQDWMVEVFNKDPNLRKVLFEYLKPYGPITQDERPNGLWRLRLSNGPIAKLIKLNKKIREDTIEYIFANKELARMFVAAFWDAEGTVRRQGNYYHLYLYNTDKYLVDTICNFLSQNGIKFSIHSRKTRDKDYYIKGRPVISRKTLHRIAIPKSSFRTWIEEIGIYLNHTKKKEVVNEILKIYGGKQNE